MEATRCSRGAPLFRQGKAEARNVLIPGCETDHDVLQFFQTAGDRNFRQVLSVMRDVKVSDSVVFAGMERWQEWQLAAPEVQIKG